ncbi:MAG: serine hydrolase [Acidimicrobiia bacterium]|jgi:CubicO group peptidase (beta-lactamase class C family)
MDQLAASVHEIASESGFSGVVRVDHRGDTRLSEAFGWAHRGLRQPNTADTQFAIASGGKGLTALAVVSLIVEGALSLETTARSVLGEDLPQIAEDVTVWHLLAHRSGIGDYLDEESEDLDLNDYVLASPVQDLDTTEAFLREVDGFPTKFGAGERFSYSNGGYIVLAVIAERAAGVSYHDLVEERVLEPAGMTDTGFLRSDEPSGRMALGYLHGDGLRTNVFHLPVRGNGDGGVYTTVGDMYLFWHALFNGLIVPTEWLAEMIRPHSENPEEETRYGLGFWLAPAGATVSLVGGDAGVSFHSAHNPNDDLTWTVISNTTDGAWPMVRHLKAALHG